MTKLDHALALAAAGFWIFPLKPGAKTPAAKGWQAWATRDAEKLRAHWTARPDDNIGIFTSRFGDDEALVVVDIDTKNGKDGNATLLAHELAGNELPDTREHATPTGGRHLLYRVLRPVQQGADRLGSGVDVRSNGGLVVAPGSTIGEAVYRTHLAAPLAPCPQWVIAKCGEARRRRDERGAAEVAGVDRRRAYDRAKRYLLADAPTALDPDAYLVACHVKDFGVTEAEAVELMQTYWDPRCEPPRTDNTVDPVRNAYRYGLEPVGVAAPEADFPAAAIPAAEPAAETPHPIDALNKCHVYVVAGGGDHILWETTDEYGRRKVEHLNVATFHRYYAAQQIQIGNKSIPVTDMWIKDKKRRSADGIVFMPGQQAPERFYNLWDGFAVEPLDGEPTAEAQAALDAFLEHAKENVCNGDEALCRWLIGYFAHLVQRPWEKPLVALVFKGGKGVGKNALVERVGSLLGGHFLLTSNRRYLVGNFNGHLENCLLFGLDEAFWSGDKQAEGTLKDLITGAHHVIEHKGKEPYKVDNRTRVCIIGNEEWLVPATHDERRFAVFEVGDRRKQDRRFFEEMRVGMERGGYRLLLRYLQRYDLSGVDPNDAPRTKALLDQQHSSLSPFGAWWLACLTDGRLVASDFGGEWPRDVECERFRAAFRRYVRERGIRLIHKADNPDEKTIGKLLKSWGVAHTRRRAGSGLEYIYRVPALAEARAAWGAWVGQAVEWPE